MQTIICNLLKVQSDLQVLEPNNAEELLAKNGKSIKNS